MSKPQPDHVHYRTCNLCEAMCGLRISLRDQQIVAITGDKDDPFSRGHICPKAVALQDIYHDPDRLKFPVRRTAGGWQRIDWDEAFAEVAARLRAVQAAHGRNAVGIYQGNPSVHNMGTLLYAAPFIRALRTRNRFSATSVDQLPHHLAAYLMFGHQYLVPVPDVDRTDYMLILGANPLVSNGSMMTAAGIADRLRRIQQRGGKIVVIDPRRSETAARADEHFFARPGSDALLLAAMLHVIFAEGLARTNGWQAYSDHLAQAQEAVAAFTPARVADAVGMAAADICRLAREFCAATRAVCYGRIGTSTQAFGGLCHWLINLLNIVSGNFDRAGGAMFTHPAIDVVSIVGATGRTGGYGRWRSRVRGLPEFGGELPVAALAEEILTPGEERIRALVTSAGNPVLSTPHGRQLDDALAQLDFMVAIDIYVNETTRHAHIILPPTTGLETSHYDLAFHVLAVQNTAKYSPALFAPEPDMRHDWQIFQALRAHLEAGEGEPPRRDKGDVFQRRPETILDLGLRYGPYGSWGGRRGRADGLNLAKLKRQPHGVDLGALRSCMPARLYTPTHRIELAPELFVADMARLAAHFFGGNAGREHTFDLALIGRRQLRSNNSWMHNSHRLVKGKERCTLLLHPEDAAVRGLQTGDMALVCSRVGQVRAQVAVSDEVMAGVVSLPHGWGHDRSGILLAVARENAGISINDLTDDHTIDPLTGNAAFSNVRVRVEKA
ncbi:MAG: molybdopterin-dependent oxidoreductase [Anaerolineales bacterium]|nr:molybdopterin-dependent oxidoreductase [Anaerolineales bacterium]